MLLNFRRSQWRIQDFPEVRSPNLRGGGGAPTYDFAKFSQKLHEIERTWTPGGGACIHILLCRSATGSVWKHQYYYNFKQECIPVGCILPTAVAICWGVSASVHAGIHPQAWAWTPPLGLGLDNPRVWAWTPPSQTPNLPPGSGPRHPSWPDPQPPPPPGLGLDTPPPVDRILDTRF